MTLESLLELAKQAEFSHYGPLNVAALEFRPEVREMCAADQVPQLRAQLDLPAPLRDAGGDGGPGAGLSHGNSGSVHRRAGG